LHRDHRVNVEGEACRRLHRRVVHVEHAVGRAEAHHGRHRRVGPSFPRARRVAGRVLGTNANEGQRGESVGGGGLVAGGGTRQKQQNTMTTPPENARCRDDGEDGGGGKGDGAPPTPFFTADEVLLLKNLQASNLRPPSQRRPQTHLLTLAQRPPTCVQTDMFCHWPPGGGGRMT
jgi:hypothetical protein